MSKPYQVPPVTTAALVREVLQGLVGHIDLCGLGRVSVRIPKRHLSTWKATLEEVLRRVEHNE